MGKPNYRVIVSFDRDRAVYSARAPELEHLSGEGPSRAVAIAALEVEIDAQLANMLSHGTTPPKAVDDVEFSGELSAKVSRALHRDLSLAARSDGIEVDQLVSELLAAALTARQGARGGGRTSQGQGHNHRAGASHEVGDDIGNRIDAPRGGGGRGYQRGNFNNQLLDDRANFIEYVRGLEQGNHNGNHARAHGGGHGGHRGDHGGGGGHGGGPGGHGGRRRRGGGRGGPLGPQGPRQGNPQGNHQGNAAQRMHGGPQGAPQGAPPSIPGTGPAPRPAPPDPDTQEG
jgi:hypothetical protein